MRSAAGGLTSGWRVLTQSRPNHPTALPRDLLQVMQSRSSARVPCPAPLPHLHSFAGGLGDCEGRLQFSHVCAGQLVDPFLLPLTHVVSGPGTWVIHGLAQHLAKPAGAARKIVWRRRSLASTGGIDGGGSPVAGRWCWAVRRWWGNAVGGMRGLTQGLGRSRECVAPSRGGRGRRSDSSAGGHGRVWRMEW